jgi:UDP-N-acetylglucosamine 1-carboxyvinyltransferase
MRAQPDTFRPPGRSGPQCFPAVPAPPDSPHAHKMPAFIVQGGHILSGRIRPAGNKNAALPCITACLLSTEPVTLSNVPRVRDVLNLLEIMESLGAAVEWTEGNTVRIDASSVTAGNVDREMAAKLRASLLVAGPLLARFGEVNLPPPGGDVIGRRRMDTHFLAFEAMGGRVRLG